MFCLAGLRAGAAVRWYKQPTRIRKEWSKKLALFDLVRANQTPAVPREVKMVAEETILKKVEALPLLALEARVNKKPGEPCPPGKSKVNETPLLADRHAVKGGDADGG